MGAKLCTSKANRQCKEHQGINGNNRGNPVENKLKRPRPHLCSDNSTDYKSKSIHKKTDDNNSNIIGLTPYSSIGTLTENIHIPLYEQLNDSNNNSNLPLNQNNQKNQNNQHYQNVSINLDPGFVMISEPSNADNDTDNNAFGLPAFGKSNTSFGSNSFYASPKLYMGTDESLDQKQQDTDNQNDDIIIDQDEVYTPPKHEITIGDVIELNIEYNSLHGVVKFIGEIIGKKGIWYGLQLNRPKGSDDVIYWKLQSNIYNKLNHSDGDGDGDGCYDGICYFKCDENEGLFVRKTQIARTLIVNYSNPRVTINQLITIKKYDTKGKIRYIGKPEFENDENIHKIYYGIQLLTKEKQIETNDGTFHNRRYFTDCPCGYGVFVTSSDLSQYIVPSRYNLLCHGYFQCKINIPPGIVYSVIFGIFCTLILILMFCLFLVLKLLSN